MTVQFEDLFRNALEVAGAKAEATAKATERRRKLSPHWTRAPPIWTRAT